MDVTQTENVPNACFGCKNKNEEMFSQFSQSISYSKGTSVFCPRVISFEQTS